LLHFHSSSLLQWGCAWRSTGGTSSRRGFTAPTSTKSVSFALKKNLSKQILINNQIRSREVRLIDEQGEQIGVVPLNEALKRAQAVGLDLIQVTEKVDPPVTRIADYGKYLYQQGKKDREAKKHTGGDLKEIRLTFNISDHDLTTRVSQAEKFLKRGDNIRINLRLRGRQKALLNHAREKILKFTEQLNALIPIRTERDMKLEPRGLTMVITRK